MKLTLKATVKAINPTESSSFVNGVQDVTLLVDNGERTANLVFPLASREHARELGALYWKHHAVTITIEAGEDDAAYLPEIETRLRASAAAFGPDHYESAWLTRAADSVRRVWEGPPVPPGDCAVTSENERLRATVQKLTTDYQSAAVLAQSRAARIGELNETVDGLSKLATARFERIGELESVVMTSVTRTGLYPMAPLVNGRPSCCGAVSNATGGIVRGPLGWAIINGYQEHAPISFCPFCGAKLPEVQP